MKIPTFSGLRPDPDVEKQGGFFARNPTDPPNLALGKAGGT